MKNYIIVGDNNTWYATTGLVTEQGLQEEIKRVKEYVNEDKDEFVSELYVYEASETSLTINL